METMSNLRRFRHIENSEKVQICTRLSEETSLPCYDLSSSEDLDQLFESIISYYGEEEDV